MGRTISVFMLTVVLLLISTTLSAQKQEYSPFYKISSIEGTIEKYRDTIRGAIENMGFYVLGEYHPAGSRNHLVICYTWDDLIDVSLKFKDRGALAAVQRIGIKSNNGLLDITMINPHYIFYAYLVDDNKEFESTLNIMAKIINISMFRFTMDFEPFGETMTKEELQSYRFTPDLPKFTEPAYLWEFPSFETGVSTIRKNLGAGKEYTSKVYELVNEQHEVAVFGVAMKDTRKGDLQILREFGEDIFCALPYEMILQGKILSILPGEYRLPLFWPGLSIKYLPEIQEIDNNIEGILKGLAE